jgi:hypothetical protein
MVKLNHRGYAPHVSKKKIEQVGRLLQDTRYIKYAEQERNARNNRITVKYPA